MPLVEPFALMLLKLMFPVPIVVVTLSAVPAPVALMVLLAPVNVTVPPPAALKSVALVDPESVTPPVRLIVEPLLLSSTHSCAPLFAVALNAPKKFIVPPVAPWMSSARPFVVRVMGPVKVVESVPPEDRKFVPVAPLKAPPPKSTVPKTPERLMLLVPADEVIDVKTELELNVPVARFKACPVVLIVTPDATSSVPNVVPEMADPLQFPSGNPRNVFPMA